MNTQVLAPHSGKVRNTKVAVSWFYDEARKQWRFLPTDLTHRAEYERTDALGNPLQPARAHEHKGWTPADQALRHNPESRKTAPAEVKQRFGVSDEAA